MFGLLQLGWAQVEMANVFFKTSRMIRDAQTFNERLSKLDGFGDSGTALRDAAAAKAVVNRPAGGSRTGTPVANGTRD